MIDLTQETPISISDVAKMFGVSRSTTDAWRKKGLECFRMGGKVFTTKEALNRFQQPDSLPEDGSFSVTVRDHHRREKEISEASTRLRARLSNRGSNRNGGG